METTTMFDAKFDTALSELFRRRIEETPEGPKEHYEMRTNLDPEGDWIACPSGALTYFTMVGNSGFSVRNVLLNFVGESRQLEKTFAELKEWQVLADKYRTQHYEDIAVIRDRLVAEAENRGWCSEFDDIIEEVNQKLHVEMERRESEYELVVSFSVSGSTTVRVTATSAEEAAAFVRDDADAFLDVDEIVVDAARYGGFDIDDIEQN
jgi:hypothetical protein